MDRVRVRFAPSPTGYLHVGGARTALMNYLFARHHGGVFVLRIEDTDLERSSRELEEQLLDTMLWLGLEWDEGPRIGGAYGPYRQSERIDIYKRYAEELVKSGKAYRVYASPEEIDQVRERLVGSGRPPHFSFEDFQEYMTPEREKEYNERGENPVIFFKMPRKAYRLADLIKGEINFKEGSIGDFVILRSNGLPTYNFACVVDDHDMEITHVIRGDDHLSNTLRQLAIYEAFEWEPPRFAHVSMILAPDGSKLSKRHGAVSVEEFAKQGILPEAMVNFLALLGWSHPEGREILSLRELIESFDLDRVHSSPAIFDVKKLYWMNGVYIRNCDIERIAQLVVPYVASSGLMTKDQIDANIKWFKAAVDAVRSSVELLSEFPDKLRIFLEEPEIPEDIIFQIKEKGLRQIFQELQDGLASLENWTPEAISSAIKKVLKDFKVDRKDFYKSLRKLLTGAEEGPELLNVIYLLGRGKVLKRLEKVKSQA
ncbi:MAG TPA: glutamate--tRNA ligase [Thermotogae bacterium]|nr:glutamate--tRNA ligase [Thermotogota bacterium]